MPCAPVGCPLGLVSRLDARLAKKRAASPYLRRPQPGDENTETSCVPFSRNGLESLKIAGASGDCGRFLTGAVRIVGDLPGRTFSEQFLLSP